MNLKAVHLAGSAILICVGLAACEKSVPIPKSELTAAAPSNVARPPSNPNEVNDPIKAENFSVKLEIDGTPVKSPDGKTATLKVKVTNNGKQPISGTGKYPVNLGIMILGDDGTPHGAGGLLDFMRTPLPLLASGASAVIDLTIGVDDHRVVGRKLKIGVVQEGVRWYAEPEDGPLQVGPF